MGRARVIGREQYDQNSVTGVRVHEEKAQAKRESKSLGTQGSNE